MSISIVYQMVPWEEANNLNHKTHSQYFWKYFIADFSANGWH